MPRFFSFVVFNEQCAVAVYFAANGDEGFIGTVVVERVAVNTTSLLIIFVFQYEGFIIVVQIALIEAYLTTYEVVCRMHFPVNQEAVNVLPGDFISNSGE